MNPTETTDFKQRCTSVAQVLCMPSRCWCPYKVMYEESSLTVLICPVFSDQSPADYQWTVQVCLLWVCERKYSWGWPLYCGVEPQTQEACVCVSKWVGGWLEVQYGCICLSFNPHRTMVAGGLNKSPHFDPNLCRAHTCTHLHSLWKQITALHTHTHTNTPSFQSNSIFTHQFQLSKGLN